MAESGIGKLERVPLREVWKHEALDFTKWLEGNIDVLGPPIMRDAISKRPISLNDNERAFFSEAVFLLRTFFFVYIGLSVRLYDWWPFALGAIITGALFVARIPIVRLSVRTAANPGRAWLGAALVTAAFVAGAISRS